MYGVSLDNKWYWIEGHVISLFVLSYEHYICDRICKKVPFSHIKFDLIFKLQSFVTFVSLLSSVCNFPMSRTTLTIYILMIKESWMVQEVKLWHFVSMSNVWKRYLFANLVTFFCVKQLWIQKLCKQQLHIIVQVIMYGFNMGTSSVPSDFRNTFQANYEYFCYSYYVTLLRLIPVRVQPLDPL